MAAAYLNLTIPPVFLPTASHEVHHIRLEIMSDVTTDPKTSHDEKLQSYFERSATAVLQTFDRYAGVMGLMDNIKRQLTHCDFTDWTQIMFSRELLRLPSLSPSNQFAQYVHFAPRAIYYILVR